MNWTGSIAFIAASLASGLGAIPASAQEFGLRDSVSGVLVVGVAHGSGETPGLEGGFGKLNVGNDKSLPYAQSVVAWHPRLTQRLGAVVSVSGTLAEHATGGLDEAYFTLRADPGAGLRLSGRAGIFFPPISLEHDGDDWSPRYTLTPSMINSWVAEEVKTVGVELTARGQVFNRPAGLTVAVFGGNDTSGALLAFRGWAQHDRRAVVAGHFKIAPLSAMFQGGQGANSRSIDEVDNRPGTYGRFEMAVSDTLDISLFAYDNGGDRKTIVAGQYAWRTRFGQAALRWNPSRKTEVIAQAMTGNTGMGSRIGSQYPADIGFAAIFGLVSRAVGPGNIALRAEQFSIDDRSFKATDNNAEHGWSGTASWSQPVSARTQIVAEGTLAQSDRPSRARVGLSRAQTAISVRAALKTQF